MKTLLGHCGRSSIFHFFVALVVICFTGPAAFATDYFWNVAGPGGADWNTPANWTPAGPPTGGAGNIAHVTNGGDAQVTTGFDQIQDLDIGNAAGGAVDQSGGSGSLTGWLALGNNEDASGASFGNYNLSGTGSITAENFRIGLNSSANSTFTQTGGTATATGPVVIGGWINGNSSTTGTGTYTISAGTLNVGDDTNYSLDVGSHGTGHLNISGTAIVNVPNGDSVIGNDTGSNGTVTQTGGTVTMHAGGTSWLKIGLNGTGTYNMEGGSFSEANRLQMGGDSFGNSGNGTFNLSGGTAIIADVERGAGTANFTFTGGTLRVGTYNAGNLTQTSADNASLLDVSTQTTTFNAANYTVSGTAATANIDNANALNVYAANNNGVAFGGILTIDGGAKVTMGANAGNQINIDGNSKYGGTGATNNSLNVGFNGAATLTINGGTLTTRTGDAFIGSNLGSNGTVNQNGGAVNMHDQSGSWTYLGFNEGANGTYNLSLGTFNEPNYLIVGHDGAGLFSQTGGSSTIGTAVSIGGDQFADGKGNGTYNLQGGTLTTPLIEPTFAGGISGSSAFNFTGGTLRVGMYSLGDLTQQSSDAASVLDATTQDTTINGNYQITAESTHGAFVTISNGHTLQVNGQVVPSSGTVHITQDSGNFNNTTFFDIASGTATSTYNLSGTGAINPGGDFNVTDQGGNGTLNQSGGAISVTNGDYYVGKDGGSSGIVTQTGGTATVALTHALILTNSGGTTGTYNLNGGTLITSSIVSGSGTAIFSFGGGVLQANGTLNTDQPITVTSSGGTVDSNSNDVTFTGTLTSSGQLTKISAGALEIDAAPVLNSDSSFAVNGGTLRFNVNSGSPVVGSGVTVTVGSTATLELAGSVSALDPIVKGRANITNNGALASGGMMLVSGTNQQVGTIDGNGDLQVNDGSDLTADRVRQHSLAVGGPDSSGAASRVTIRQSGPGGGSVVNNTAFSGNLNSLTIANDGNPLGNRTYRGTLDINNNGLVIPYGANPNPFSAIEDMVRAGYDNAHFDLPGLVSSTAAAQQGLNVAVADNAQFQTPFTTFEGQTVSTTSVLVRMTYMDDLQLTGDVTQNDAIIFGSNYDNGAASNHTWTQGDINHDGRIDQNDAILFGSFYNPALPPLDGNGGGLSQFGSTLGGSGLAGNLDAVPEPATILLAICALIGLWFFVRPATHRHA